MTADVKSPIAARRGAVDVVTDVALLG